MSNIRYEMHQMLYRAQKKAKKRKVFNRSTLIQLLIFFIVSIIMMIILDNLNEKSFVFNGMLFNGMLIAFYLLGRSSMNKDFNDKAK